MSINPSPITPRQFARRLAIFLPVLGIILTYTYAYIFELPYPGFEIAVSQIAVIHAPNTDLQVGDYLTQVGNTSISDFKDDLNRSLFEGMQVGEVVPLEVKRGAVPVKVQWQFTGTTLLHVAFRLFAGHWWLAYIFLLGGGLALWRSTLETEQQKILAAFFFITAIIIITSSVAWWHVWGGAVLMRAAIWIAIPIYLHLHWIFPKPFAPIHPAIHYVGYAASVAAAFAELFRLLPVHWHEFGFVIAMLGSLLLHIIRFVREKDQRRDTFRLFAALIIPSVALGVTGLASIFGYDLPLTLLTIGFYTQGVIPFAYISVANRRRRGYFETQFNEITTISLFIAIILLVTALATEILTSFLILSPFSGVSLLIALVSFIVGTIFGVYLYPRFKQIIEQGWLGVPVSPSRIIESYASSIIRLANVAELADLLRHTVVPSLVIHQSALILIEGQELKTLYAIGVTPDALPAYDEIADLLGRSRALNTQLSNRIGQKHPWIQVVLPIKNNDHLLGFWLLGHHGSTDSYDPSEINTLNALGHFTAIALGQIIQSKTLRALYKRDIDRNEDYRASLSRELHDSTSQLKFLKDEIAKFNLPPEFFVKWDKVMNDIRHAITNLRPKMLDYGVGFALRYLRDETEQQADGDLDIVLDVKEDGSRYDLHIEQHIYRIIQQACENALQHSHATTITIRGTVNPRGVDLTVEDNGVGFPFGGELDTTALVDDDHLGIAGMFQRANIIRASLTIDSKPRQGTRVYLRWQP